MADENVPVNDAASKSPREQIIALQAQMAESQSNVAKRLAEHIASDVTASFIEALKQLQAESTPGSQLDQTIGQLIAVTAHTGQVALQLHQALAQQPR